MPKVCDNKCVGMLVWDGDKLLLIERKEYNFGFAPPAGHLDGLSPEEAAKNELREEVGLETGELRETLSKNIPNPCRREQGSHHLWFIYEISRWSGSVKPSADETKGYLWADKGKLRELAKRLEDFAGTPGLDVRGLPSLVDATNLSADWKNNPGLEPPWYFILKELGII